jgi:hypothetical protein
VAPTDVAAMGMERRRVCCDDGTPLTMRGETFTCAQASGSHTPKLANIDPGSKGWARY